MEAIESMVGVQREGKGKGGCEGGREKDGGKDGRVEGWMEVLQNCIARTYQVRIACLLEQCVSNNSVYLQYIFLYTYRHA